MADTFTDAIESKAMGGPAFSQEGLDLVKTFESFQPNAYYDLNNKKKKGKLTVGYGFTKYDIPNLKEGYRIDRAYAEQLLPALINKKYGPSVTENVTIPLNDQQYSALTSFVYNVGPTAFKNSTLLKKLNSGDLEGASQEFMRWTKAGGKDLEGLRKRRAAEAALFRGDIQTLGSILENQKFGLGSDLSSTQPQEDEGMSLTLSPAPDMPEEDLLVPETKGAMAAAKVAESFEESVEEKATEPEKEEDKPKTPAQIAEEMYKQFADKEKEKPADVEIAENVLFGDGGIPQITSGLVPGQMASRVGLSRRG